MSGGVSYTMNIITTRRKMRKSSEFLAIRSYKSICSFYEAKIHNIIDIFPK